MVTHLNQRLQLIKSQSTAYVLQQANLALMGWVKLIKF